MDADHHAGTGVVNGGLPVCGNETCGEPVVFTFEFPGAEYHCVACGWLGGIFDPPRVAATPGRVARYYELAGRYENERIARGGQPHRAEEPAAPPTCVTCGATPDVPFQGDKPIHWYRATRNGVTQYACSPMCIPADEIVMPW